MGPSFISPHMSEVYEQRRWQSIWFLKCVETALLQDRLPEVHTKIRCTWTVCCSFRKKNVSGCCNSAPSVIIEASSRKTRMTLSSVFMGPVTGRLDKVPNSDWYSPKELRDLGWISSILPMIGVQKDPVIFCRMLCFVQICIRSLRQLHSAGQVIQRHRKIVMK